MNKYSVIDKQGFPHIINADILQVDGIECLFMLDDCNSSIVAVFYEPTSIVRVEEKKISWEEIKNN